MPNADDALWFKKNFHGEISKATQGTVFDVDMLTAIACQETGELWQAMRHKELSLEQIVAFCCGDTLDEDKGRSAFPKTKSDLIGHPRGQEMFDIARQALLSMAEHVPGYGFAKTKKDKFCHGYGVFQYDLQFFKTDPDYFLEKRYEKFDQTLDRALGELKNGLKKLGLDHLPQITDYQFATVAIAYNTGSYNPSKGLKQGHKNGGKYYGELVYDYLMLSRTVALPGAPAVISPPQPGSAVMPPPPQLTATGPQFRVDTMISSLRLRSKPEISEPPTKNVIVELPDGHLVRAITGNTINGFIEIEAALGGGVFRGFASAKFLVREPLPQAAPVHEAAQPGAVVEAAQPAYPAVEMPRKAGTITRRTENANAHSLNESGMPRRSAADVYGLRAELGEIIAYLAPDKAAHKRYQPRSGLTFCNIYAHDYCMLAGVYLPRMWWTSPALIKLSQNKPVEPLYGDTIVEMRANDLFRWLRDFGQTFGWRQVSSTDELQLHANRGGVCLIVARRTEDGRSGHIVSVVPETATQSAKRNSAGEVTSPLQSQAGATNFSYGTSTANWWKAAKFAESAFWVHA